MTPAQTKRILPEEAADFADFLPLLHGLQAELAGTARFTTMERQLEFSIVGDGRGHLEVSGHAWEMVGWDGPRLTWSLTAACMRALRGTRR